MKKSNDKGYRSFRKKRDIAYNIYGEPKALIDMSHEELLKESLTQPMLNYNPDEFIKTPREKTILKRMKTSYKNTSEEIKKLESTALAKHIFSSRAPRWDSIIVKL